MSPLELEVQINRLNEAFKNFYSKSRAKMIANIVSDLPQVFFEKCVDRILWQRDPPRIEWFYELVSSYHRRQKACHEIEQMHPTEGSILDSKAVAMMKEYAARRINGALSDQDYHDFQRTIRQVISGRKDIKCKTCLDQKVYLPYMKNDLEKCWACA